MGFDSNFEREYADELEKLHKAGAIADWQNQATIQIESPITGHLLCRYRTDFKVTHNDGVIEWIETKYGHEDALWDLKKKLMKEVYIPFKKNEIFSIAKKRMNGKPSYLPKARKA